MGDCECSKHIYEWVYLFRIHLWVGVGICDHLWVGVPFKITSMGGCDCLEDIFGWVRMFTARLWMGVPF